MAVYSMLALLTGCVMVLVSLRGAQGEMFTSLADMEKVLDAEHNTAHSIRKYIDAEKDRLAKLEKIADDMEIHSTDALVDPEHHLANPVNSFLLVKRLTADWEDVSHTLLGNKNSKSEDLLNEIFDSSSCFPQKEDLQGAAKGLARIQDTYALSADEIASGTFLADPTDSPSFTAGDCYELGKQVYFINDHYHSVLWMEEALKRLDKETVKTANRADILDFLSFSHSTFGNLRKALNLTIEWLQLDPGHERAMANKRYYERAIEEHNKQQAGDAKGDTGAPVIDGQPHRYRDGYMNTISYDNYEKLCRGEETHERPQKHKLTCQYKRHHPIFYISPLKEELLNINPNLYVYHDVITNQQNQLIKDISMPKLHRSGVFVKQESDSHLTESRTSKTAWHADWEHPMIARVSLKASAITNLTLESVEHLQVLNYGIGGHYEPHYDFAQSHELYTFEEWRRNRIATFICYLTELKAGGYTVYPELGAYVVPRKNSCALWFNLKKNGDGDYNTYHAACPILNGYKWVANKWFHETGQEFVRPCSLKKEE